MVKKKMGFPLMGFTLVELLAVLALLGILLTLATPSWEQAGQKRRITNVTEQVAAFLVVAQSEAQRRNQPVSLSFSRTNNQQWCIGAVVGTTGCDCTETDTASAQFCAIDGNQSKIEATDFQFLSLVTATDTQPGTGDSQVTFDPIRGILQPAGDRLQFTFESMNGDFRLQLGINPTGLLSICKPGSYQEIGGYRSCAG